MSVLIFTEPDDIHAVLVKLALEDKGYESELFFTADMPALQQQTVSINQSGLSWNSQYGNESKNDWTGKKIDSVWWRRPRLPSVPSNVHKEDRKFVKRENNLFHMSLPFLLKENVWWVNPINANSKAKSKIIQLKTAVESGFKIPKTLVSNSPTEIKNFILQSKSAVIYKPFAPHYWVDNDGMRLLYTDKISLNDLPSDNMTQMVPGIYQDYIEKKYELRVTCFGTYVSAVKIDSQYHLQGQTDWRQIPGSELRLSSVSLSEVQNHMILNFMRKMGVVFGCFDFIVTPKDELVFLELNEQGQFLWVEEILPELCYMDMFAEFISQKKFDFTWKEKTNTLSTRDYDALAQKIVDENIKKHIYLNQVKNVVVS